MKGLILILLIMLLSFSLLAEWTIVGSYDIPGKASGLAYDGTYLYFGIYGAQGDNVYRFDPVTGETQLQFNNPLIGDSYGMSYDGEYLWITDHSSPSSTPAYAMQLDLSGNVISQFNLPDHYMSGIAYDDGDFWVMTYHPNPGTVYKVTNTGSILSQFVPPNDQPWDICIDGDNLWIVDYWEYTISKVDQTGTVLETQMSEIQRPAGIVHDGTYLWYLAGAVGAPSTLYKVDLGGTGTPVINLSLQEYDFDNVVIDEVDTVTLNISNSGTGDLVIDEFSFASTAFFTDTAVPITLEPDETVEITISFSPDSWGQFIDIMGIHSNDPINPVSEVALNGYGVYSDPYIVVNPDNLDYGQVRIGADTGRFFTITNYGLQSLQINEVTFSNPNFYIDNSVVLPVVINTRQEYDLRIWYNPDTQGQETAAATISSNDPVQNQVEITLVGTGNVPDLSIGSLLWSLQTYGSASSNIRAIEPISDIWGNGKDDVIVAGEDYYIRALNGNSCGTADVIWEYFNQYGALQGKRALSIAGDLNNDGFHDVVIGTSGSDRAVKALSGKTGELLWNFNTNIYGNGGWVYQVDARFDYNGDGVPDVLAATGDDNNNNGPKRIFLLNGLTGNIIWERYAGGPAFSVIGVQDFTGNGIPDVVAGASNEAESQARVHGINGLTGEIMWTVEPPGSSVWALIQIDDLTNNGIPDVLIGSFMGGGNYTALNSTNGATIWNGSSGASLVMDFKIIGDVNGNGYNDIAIGHSTSHTAILDGFDGMYIWSQNTADQAWHVANAGDLTGNGINDLAVGTLYQNNVGYMIDSTDGNFLSTIPTGTPVDAMNTIPDVCDDNSREMVIGGRNGLISCYSGGFVTPPDPGWITGTVEIGEGPGEITDVLVSVGDVSVSPDTEGLYELEVAPGTHSVSFSLYGYQTVVVANVVVVAGETTENVDAMLYPSVLQPPINLEADPETGEMTWESPADTRRFSPDSYNVYLNGEYQGNTEELNWTFTDLIVDTSYLAGVSALYYTGESVIETISFVYTGPVGIEQNLPMVTQLKNNYPNPCQWQMKLVRFGS